jgi:hypothetical protein
MLLVDRKDLVKSPLVATALDYSSFGVVFSQANTNSSRCRFWFDTRCEVLLDKACLFQRSSGNPPDGEFSPVDAAVWCP